jgi:hypothetical protein
MITTKLLLRFLNDNQAFIATLNGASRFFASYEIKLSNIDKVSD